MTQQTARPTLSALPDWSAVPSNSEEDRLFLNRRLAFVGRVALLVSLSFYVVNAMVGLVFAPHHLMHFIADRSSVFHALGAGVSATQWMLCRRGNRSAAQLNVIDGAGTLLTLVMYGLMTMSGMERDQSQTLALTLITMIVLMLRAIIVPGTGRRTFIISLVACIPTLVCSFVIVTSVQLPEPWMPVAATLYVATWCGVSVAIATLASRVIYGLQKRVAEVTQLGQYTLVDKIGEGGMGAVYRAQHALLRRPTAVKLLPLERAGSAEMQRFEREVQLTASLTHPNTISVYDYGHTPDGVFYYAMEYLDGLTLEDLVDGDGAQPAARVAHLLRQIAGALGEAHAVGLIHRDIKPANVMICARGNIFDHVKVLDFGLVKEIDTGGDANVSTSGMLIGTPLFMAPEAITKPGDIDARADLYAVGAVAYFLLTGAPPFEGSTLLEVCGKHLHQIPARPSERGVTVPRSLEDLVLACLAKDPDERPADAAELLRELDACAGLGSWTQQDAHAWWIECAGRVRDRAAARRKRQAREGASSQPATVAIDLGGRQPGDPRVAATARI